MKTYRNFSNSFLNFKTTEQEEVNFVFPSNMIIIYLKGEEGPLHAWSGPEISRNLRFPDYMTTAQVGGKFVSLMHRPPLPPGNASVTHFC